MQYHARTCMNVQPRPSSAPSAARRSSTRSARDGKVVAARLVEELGVSEDTVRRDLRELAAQGLVQRVHGGALAPAPQQGSFSHRREMSTDAKPALAQAAVEVLARRARDHPRRLDHQPRARAPAARRPRLHRAHQLAADRRRARRAPHGRGRDDRRAARQALAGHGRGRRGRLPPHGPRRRVRARRLRAAPRGRALHRRPRGGARQARDGRGVGRRDRARHRRQAAQPAAPTCVAPVAELTHVVAEAAAPTTSCSTPTAPSASR